MSNDFYFKTWRATLSRLEILVNIDIQYQVNKVHDQLLADAVYRLTAMLGQYMTIYNEKVECVHNNIQVQKTPYMKQILKALVARIEELKHDLQKIEGSSYLFFGNGLIMHKQTTDDAEMKEIPTKVKRLPSIQTAIDNVFQRVTAMREDMDKIQEVEEEKEVKEQIQPNMFWMEPEEEKEVVVVEKQVEIPEEELAKRDFLSMIKAHEKSRQIRAAINRENLKREAWIKELKGTANPPARYEIREKSAKFIQKVFRAYFALKRQRVRDCKRDQILGLRHCEFFQPTKPEIVKKKSIMRLKLHEKYEKECLEQREKLKEEFMKRKGQDLSDDYCDRIRHWFYEWFESIQFIHDLPKPEGCAAIFREEIQSPHEWLEEYKALMKLKENSKGKTLQELKFKAEEKKRLEKQARKAQKRQQKAEAALLLKMMKHPTMHPGYIYPESKNIDQLVEAIKKYHSAWDSYDAQALSEVKKKYIRELNIENAYMDVKLEIFQQVDQYMTTEYQRLKRALRADYKAHDQVIPKQKPKKSRIKKPKKKLKNIPSEQIANTIEVMFHEATGRYSTLCLEGWIVDYPKTELDDFIGDPNFAGEDLRREIRPALPHTYEVRTLWWECCNGVAQGSRRILLVGPNGSGKIKLVHALASINDAVLFEMDPITVPEECRTPAYLKNLMRTVLTCAKAIQPSVLHIRHVEKLFYIKESPNEAKLKLGYLKKFFLQMLLKKIHKHDKITIIGSCNEPWVARVNPMLKLFPIIVLLPNTSYSIIVQMLRKWLIDKLHTMPFRFEFGCLAYMLQGYSYGSLQEAFEKYMTDERVVRTAAHGLSAMDIYNYILEDESMEKVDYNRYLKWYWEKTPVGIKEKQHFDSLMEFKEAVAAHKAKEAKKAKRAKKRVVITVKAI